MLWWLVWLCIGGVLVLLELQLGTFYFLLLGAAALVTGLLGLAGVSSLLVQGVIFAVLTFALYAFVLPRLRKRLTPAVNKVPTVAESLPGKVAIVEVPIVPGEVGQVKVNGELWSAVSDEAIGIGERVTIVEVHVSKLVVRKGAV
jgi:membrane protein implicated in regulation of membrane protease activity